MNTYIFIYDGFAQFEVILASYLLKTKSNIVTVGVDGSQIESCEGFKTIPHKILKEIKPEDVDIFIIPGGDPDKIHKKEELYELLGKLNNNKCKIGAICSGIIHFLKSGVLGDKKYTTSININEHKKFIKSNFIDMNVVSDDNLITAKANGYVDFALEIGKIMGIYSSDDDYNETVNFFKYFKYE
ncbi:MAG: DJ-1/PfpI family protein [Spirochaetales bacterium]|nr:DJ-1/PfpI family protein [Spirochaetales bacterium]